MTDSSSLTRDLQPGVDVIRSELVSLAGDARRIATYPERIRAGLNPGLVNSPRQGHGMDFAESRPWVPGDDARNMDWRVTARTGKAHTKLFEEDKDQPWVVIVDQRPSLAFGTRVRFKHVQSARIGALLLWTAVTLGNRCGGAVIREDGFSWVPLQRGRQAALQLIGQLADQPILPERRGIVTEFNGQTLDGALGQVPVGAAVFIISDFVGWAEDAWHAIARRGHRKVICGIRVTDQVETQAPPPGRYPVVHESQSVVLALSGEQDQQHWMDAFGEHADDVTKRLAAAGARAADIRADEDAVPRITQLVSVR